MFDRRLFLATGAAVTGALAFPRLAIARAPTDRRFVFVIQRGAADGLAIIAPTGDPAFAGLRGDLAQDSATGTKLDGTFTLHPALAESAKLFAGGEALFLHAVASPYRERSHFDGQNVLETGGSAAYRLRNGWMNRLLSLLPAHGAEAVAISSTIPLALRGPVAVASYAPSRLPPASSDLLARVGQMYEGDGTLHPLWDSAMQTRGMAGLARGGDGRGEAELGALAAKLLEGDGGARIAMIETEGWDTHANQRGRLSAQLRGLDAMIASLRAGLGSDWANTVVLVATEFGRTARVNGTGGTDHGTASAAMLFGGAVAGGKVVADWPGLAERDLYEARDLKPTTDLDALIGGTLAQHFALDPAQVMGSLFPDSRGAVTSSRLIA